MTTYANTTRAELALPEAGEGYVLQFTVEDLEKVEAALGADYLDVSMKGLNQARAGVYKLMISTALKGPEPKAVMADFPWGKPLEHYQPKILDALYLTVTGRTFAEQQKYEDDLFAQRMEEAKENPRLAAALFFQESAAPAPGPASAPPKSED